MMTYNGQQERTTPRRIMKGRGLPEAGLHTAD